MINKVQYLDGEKLYNAISIGIKNLIVHQKTLDEINVFPVNIVDSIGAGDAYHATFLYTHIALGWSVKKACIYGSAAAALSCTKAGARDGLPTLEEIDSFVKRA